MPASSSTFHLISSQTFNTARSSKKLQINSSSGAEERRRTRSSDIIIINREGENMRPHEEYPKKLSNGSSRTAIGKMKKQQERGVRYRECRKNHAANIGGYAVDGCREFMASGEEGTSAALRCAACSCHRNFHKREVENDDSVCDCSSISTSRS